MSRVAIPISYFDPGRDLDGLDPAKRDLVRRRIGVLGPSYRLFYHDPVEFIRGSGTKLYSADGAEYLDAYNNVPSVGHAHPRVAAAVSKQSALLATHTRYLDRALVEYAEDLLGTMPHTLGHVMLTCTGSEANDLALRVAKHCTGGTGVIVTRNAYHGNTTEIAAISPAMMGLSDLAPWVRVVPAPDARLVDDPAALATWMVERVQAAIDELADAGIRFAAFVADSVFASDGVFTDPPGFLAPVREVVKSNGGVYIADEVQPGFGRLGTSMWGFERHSTAELPFLPDIVTMGKPMGNGYPVAATVLTPEVVESFGNDLAYFNTFGGNVVAVAAAQAVLDVVRDEDLMGNALRVGSRLRRHLEEIAARHRRVGQVRGSGLFLALELLTEDGEPDDLLCQNVSNALRRQHILVGTAGIANDALKIRPPLCFSEADADRFAEGLAVVLTQLGV